MPARERQQVPLYNPEGTVVDIGVKTQRFPFSPGEAGFSKDAILEAREKKYLDGQIIIVAGAGHNGIGEKAAEELALQGATVIVTTRPQTGPQDNPWNLLPQTETSRELVEKLHTLGSKDSTWLPLDITKTGTRDGVIDMTIKKFGRIDGLVMAVGDRKKGIGISNFFIRRDLDDLNRFRDVNQVGPEAFMFRVLQHMKEQRSGKIIYFSSLASVSGQGQVEYATHKAWGENFVMSVAQEMAGFGVSLMGIAPGYVEGTSMVEDIAANEKYVTELLKQTGAERALIPQEVAELTAYLMSPQSEALSGPTYPIIGVGEKPIVNNQGLIER